MTTCPSVGRAVACGTTGVLLVVKYHVALVATFFVSLPSHPSFASFTVTR